MGLQDITTTVDKLVGQANSTVVVKVFEALKKQHIVEANHGENCGCEGCKIIKQYRTDVLRVWRRKRRLLREEFNDEFPLTKSQQETQLIEINKVINELLRCREERKRLKENKNFDLDRVL